MCVTACVWLPLELGKRGCVGARGELGISAARVQCACWWECRHHERPFQWCVRAVYCSRRALDQHRVQLCVWWLSRTRRRVVSVSAVRFPCQPRCRVCGADGAHLVLPCRCRLQHVCHQVLCGPVGRSKAHTKPTRSRASVSVDEASLHRARAASVGTRAAPLW